VTLFQLLLMDVTILMMVYQKSAAATKKCEIIDLFYFLFKKNIILELLQLFFLNRISVSVLSAPINLWSMTEIC
jgi:hypothetical protein